MSQCIVDRIQGEDQACQQDGFVGKIQAALVDFVSDGIEFLGIVYLERLFPVGAVASVVLRKPAVIPLERIEFFYERPVKGIRFLRIKGSSARRLRTIRKCRLRLRHIPSGTTLARLSSCR